MLVLFPFPYHSYSVFIESKILLDIQKRCFSKGFLYYEGKIKIKNTNRNFTVHILQVGQENELAIR